MSFRKFVFFSVLMVFGIAGPARSQVSVYGTATGQRFGSVTCPSFASPCASNDGVVKPYGGNFGVFYDFKTYGPVRLGVDLSGDVLTANKRADSSAGGRGTVRQYTTLIGLRGSLVSRYKWLHPYAEIAGGQTTNNNAGLYTVTTTTTTFSPQTTPATPPIVTSARTFNPALNTTYGVVKGFIGLDIAIFPFLDLRAIELGVGEAFGAPLTNQSVSTSVVVDGNQFIGVNPDPNYGQVVSTSSVVTGNSYGPSSHGMQSIGAGVVLHFGAH